MPDTTVADGNDAGFRQWGRPKETEVWAKVEVNKLEHVQTLESLVLWLKTDVWGHATCGQRERIQEIRKELDALEELVEKKET